MSDIPAYKCTQCGIETIKSKEELMMKLEKLGIKKKELATLFNVSNRTVNRWLLDVDRMSEPAKQSIIAWFKIDSHGLAWRDTAECLK